MNADHLAIVEAFARGLAQGLLSPSKPAPKSRQRQAAVPEQPGLWPRMIAEPDQVPFRSSPVEDELPPASPDEWRQIEEALARDPDAPPPGMYYRDVDGRDEIVNGQLG